MQVKLMELSLNEINSLIVTNEYKRLTMVN